MNQEYKLAHKKVDSVQNEYIKMSKDKFVASFIKASKRNNPSEILTSVDAYLSNIKNTFFDQMDFSNQVLVNSSFLTNRISDFVFYINYSEDKLQQEKLHKESIKTVLSKIKSQTYKRDIIQFLIEQFEESKNLVIIDYLFEEH